MPKRPVGRPKKGLDELICVKKVALWIEWPLWLKILELSELWGTNYSETIRRCLREKIVVSEKYMRKLARLKEKLLALEIENTTDNIVLKLLGKEEEKE